jgi:hypothetical protein
VLGDTGLRATLAADAAGFIAERWSGIEMARRLLMHYERLLGRG